MNPFVRDLAVFAFGLAALSANASARCGHMYWPVKTGTDPTVDMVDLTHVVPTTAEEMDSWTPPAQLEQNQRFAPHETTVYQVSGTLVQIFFANDSDYHLLIQDASGKTVIAEIPSPDCVGSQSPFLPGITQARQAFDSHFSGSVGSQQAVSLPVTITGVGFFDDVHGQPDAATNGIELHPVLSMQVGAPARK